MEQRFTEEEQARIFTRALELQREAGTTVTLTEMQQTALEAGIDLTVLDRALQESFASHAQPEQENPKSTTWLAVAVSLFAFSHVYTASSQCLSRPANFWIPFALAAVIGGLTPSSRRYLGFALTTLSSIGVSFLTYMFLYSQAPEINPAFFSFMGNTLLIELLIFFVCRFIGDFARGTVRAEQKATA